MARHFWHEFSFPSTVDKLLETDDWTLETLLNEDDALVDDVRDKKPKVLNALSPFVEKIIGYVVGDIVAVGNHKLRFPAVASELLKVSFFVDAICKDERLLDLLLDFFAKPTVDPLLAVAVVKVLVNLVSQNHALVLQRMTQEKIADSMLNHLSTPAIADFFVEMVRLDSFRTAILKWFTDSDFVLKIYSQLDIKKQDVHKVVADVVCEILDEQDLKEDFILLFVNTKAISTLSKCITQEGNTSGLRFGLQILEKIFRLRSLNNSTKQPLAPIVTDNIFFLYKCLSEKSQLVKHTNKTDLEPLGFLRFAILHSFSALAFLKFSCVFEAFTKCGLYTLLLDQLARFPLNGFHHRCVRDIFCFTLESQPPESFVKLLTDTKLLRFLLDRHDEAVKMTQTPFYTLYLHEISRTIIRQGRKYRQIQSFLTQSDERWLDYSAFIQNEQYREEAINLEKLKTEGEQNHVSREEEPRPAYFEEEFATVTVEKDTLSPDVDMDSLTDVEDYELDDFEIVVSKEELESFYGE